jgi:tetratricopeptide (TPR) repeat protein
LQTEYARFLFKLNDYQSVIKFLQNLNNPDATQIALVAASYQRLDQHQQAVTYYRRSLAKDNRQAKNWISLGISLEQTAQLEDALRSYRSAAQLGNINARLQAFVEKRSRQIEQALN